MDARSYATANALVGNASDAAAIEIVLGDLSVAFECNTYFASTGADCGAELGGEPIRPWCAHEVYAGQRLVFCSVRARGCAVILQLAEASMFRSCSVRAQPI